MRRGHDAAHGRSGKTAATGRVPRYTARSATACSGYRASPDAIARAERW